MGNRSQEHDELVYALKQENTGLIVRRLGGGAGEIRLLYIRQLVDAASLSQFVIQPILEYLEKGCVHIKAEKLAHSVISADECSVQDDLSAVSDQILLGHAVLLLAHDERYISVNVREIAQRAIATPDFAYSILGPKDCFVESLDVNLSLIRYRLKDPKLKIDMFELGKRTKTSFAVIYIEDIANADVIAQIEARLRTIDTDAIWGTGDVSGYLNNSPYDLFEQLRVTERSDAACEAIVEGKAVLLGDGGQVALIGPTTLDESLYSSDDRYGNNLFGLFSSVLRHFAVLVSLCASAMYVALVSFHPDALPGSYVIFLAQMRQKVLLPATLEVLVVEFLLELVRETLLRAPAKIGTAIGIVGAIVIGDAATSAGIFDSLVLILAAASLLCSFAMPDYFSMYPFRILKFFVIIITGFMGFYGFVLAISFILMNLVSINSFGIPFFAPLAPFSKYDAKRSLLFSRSTTSLRMQYMKTKDDTRSSYAHNRLRRKPNKDKED